MEDFERIRRMILVERMSQREVAKQLGVARKSVRKAVENASQIDYNLTSPRACPVLDPFKPMIDARLVKDLQRGQEVVRTIDLKHPAATSAAHLRAQIVFSCRLSLAYHILVATLRAEGAFSRHQVPQAIAQGLGGEKMLVLKW